MAVHRWRRDLGIVANDEHDGLVVGHRDDRRIEADFKPGCAGFRAGVGVGLQVRRQLPELAI